MFRFKLNQMHIPNDSGTKISLNEHIEFSVFSLSFTKIEYSDIDKKRGPNCLRFEKHHPPLLGNLYHVIETAPYSL